MGRVRRHAFARSPDPARSHSRPRHESARDDDRQDGMFLALSLAAPRVVLRLTGIAWGAGPTLGPGGPRASYEGFGRSVVPCVAHGGGYPAWIRFRARPRAAVHGMHGGGPRARAREYGLRRPSRSSETRGAGRRRCHDGARFARSCGGAAGRSGPASRRGGDGSRGERPPRRRDHWRGTRAGRVDPAAPRGAAKARRDGGADQGTTQIRAEMHG